MALRQSGTAAIHSKKGLTLMVQQVLCVAVAGQDDPAQGIGWSVCSKYGGGQVL